MLKLIRLEMKKTNFTFYIQRALVASIVITGFLFVMLYFDRDLIPTGSEEFLFITDSITRMVFIIFSGVLISKLIIEEYNNTNVYLSNRTKKNSHCKTFDYYKFHFFINCHHKNISACYFEYINELLAFH